MNLITLGVPFLLVLDLLLELVDDPEVRARVLLPFSHRVNSTPLFNSLMISVFGVLGGP